MILPVPDTKTGLLDAIDAGLEHPMTIKAIAQDDPELVMHAQSNGLLMALVQGQAVGVNNAAKSFDGLGWLNVAQIVVLIMILWRVW